MTAPVAPDPTSAASRATAKVTGELDHTYGLAVAGLQHLYEDRSVPQTAKAPIFAALADQLYRGAGNVHAVLSGGRGNGRTPAALTAPTGDPDQEQTIREQSDKIGRLEGMLTRILLDLGMTAPLGGAFADTVPADIKRAWQQKESDARTAATAAASGLDKAAITADLDAALTAVDRFKAVGTDGKTQAKAAITAAKDKVNA